MSPTWVALFLISASNVVARDPLAVLSNYQGDWKTEIRRFDTPYSKAAHETREIENLCWRQGAVFACLQKVNGEQRSLQVYTWQMPNQTYSAYSIPLDGGEPGKGTLLISGDEWTYPWEQTLQGKTVHFRVINHFFGRDHIDYRREFSSDCEHWTIIETGTELKKPAPVHRPSLGSLRP